METSKVRLERCLWFKNQVSLKSAFRVLDTLRSIIKKFSKNSIVNVSINLLCNLLFVLLFRKFVIVGGHCGCRSLRFPVQIIDHNNFGCAATRQVSVPNLQLRLLRRSESDRFDWPRGSGLRQCPAEGTKCYPQSQLRRQPHSQRHHQNRYFFFFKTTNSSRTRGRKSCLWLFDRTKIHQIEWYFLFVSNGESSAKPFAKVLQSIF